MSKQLKLNCDLWIFSRARGERILVNPLEPRKFGGHFTEQVSVHPNRLWGSEARGPTPSPPPNPEEIGPPRKVQYLVRGVHRLCLQGILTHYLFQVQDTRIDQRVHGELDEKTHQKLCMEGCPPGRCNPVLWKTRILKAFNTSVQKVCHKNV